MDALQKQLNDLRAQGKEDFQFTMIAFGNMGDRMNELAKDIGIIKGKMARQEERFETILDVVQKMVNQVKSDGYKSDIWALERRVEALEKRIA